MAAVSPCFRYPGLTVALLLVVVPLAVSDGVIGTIRTEDAHPAGRAGLLSQMSFSVVPSLEIPIETGMGLFDIGGGALLRGGLALVSPRVLEPGASIGYSFLPVRSGTSLSIISAHAGATLKLDLAPRLTIFGFAEGGAYWAMVNSRMLNSDGLPYADQQGGGASVRAGLGLDFFISPILSAGLQVSIHDYFGLSPGWRASLGSSFHLDGLQRRIRVEARPTVDIFPSLYKSYASNPIARVTVRNDERFPVEHATVSIFVKELMDAPTRMEIAERILPGQELGIDLGAVLSDRLLSIVSEASFPFELGCGYSLNGKRRETSYQYVGLVHGRNAITWNDDDKIASFMDPGAVPIQAFVKPVAVMVRVNEPKAIDLNFRMAMGLFEALGAYGIGYVVDPNTPSFAQSSADPTIVDFVQYAVQTLAWKGGDCDDLTTLYCSLLESVGIESAFITVPGHIYAAFPLLLSPDEAKRTLSSLDGLIRRSDRLWVPVEITAVGQSFLTAWTLGAREWRDAEAAGKAAFHEVHESWKVWQVAGSPPDSRTSAEVPLPLVLERYKTSISSFVDHEIQDRERILRTRIAQEAEPTKAWQSLGILYARYGLFDKAEAAFLSAIANGESLPSLVNLATIYRLRGEYGQAREFLVQAEKMNARDSGVLLGQALINELLGNKSLSRTYHAKLAKVAPLVAKNYDWLGKTDETDTARARAVTTGEDVVQWKEDE